MAERYEVVIDFAKYPPGTRIVLRNTSPKNNTNFTHTDKVMMFEVTDEAFTKAKQLGARRCSTRTHRRWLVPEADAVGDPQAAASSRANGQWTINGQTWDDVVRSSFKQVLAAPVRDNVEIWELSNPSGGWHHPAHIHFIDFKILSRNGQPPLKHELGAKDVVFLGENETVRLLIKFEKGAGKYMIHCHNLVHEDHDMMGQFEIVDRRRPPRRPVRRSVPLRSRDGPVGPAMSLLERGMQRTETPNEAKSLRGYLTAGQLAAVLAAGIHAAVVPEHLQESLLIGGFFVVVALGQFGLAAVLRQRPPVLVVVGAIWAHVGLIALYVASRTVDLPFLPAHHGGEQHRAPPGRGWARQRHPRLPGVAHRAGGSAGPDLPRRRARPDRRPPRPATRPAAQQDHLRVDGTRPARRAGAGRRADRLSGSQGPCAAHVCALLAPGGPCGIPRSDTPRAQGD